MANVEEDSVRSAEVEILQCMYSEEELRFPDHGQPFVFMIRIQLEDEERLVDCSVSFVLPEAYPIEHLGISVDCDRVRREQNDQLITQLHNALAELGEDDMRVLPAVEWIKEHAAEYFTKESASKPTKSSSSSQSAEKPVKGFMREWCSFVSLYKDSYISGPNRFEVMTSLARNRGLNITGMGISGKPGGMVAEGEENEMIAFMELMRTDFFETLNPRGRKLTTRLQERWPLDGEVDRYEAAEVVLRLVDDRYRIKDRETVNAKFKAGERERLEKLETDDCARLKQWEASSGRSMAEDEARKLAEAGPPDKCTTPGVYAQCGCEAPPSREEIESQRLFKDFTIFQGKEGFEAAYQEAAKIFKEMDRMDGFDAMFTYRFS